MVLDYARDLGNWAIDQVKTTVGNIGDSTVQSKDKILYDDDLDNISRRQFIESALAAGVAYETSKAGTEAAGDAVDNINVQWKIGPVGEIPEEGSRQTPTPESTEGSDQDSENIEATTENGLDTPQSYQEFSEDLGQFGQGDIRYLHGALDADPGYVEDVDPSDSDGIQFDSVVLEYDEMSQDMADYLETADQTGNLETWLETYEDNL